MLVYGARQSQPLAQYAVGHVAPDAVSRYVLVVGQPVVATIPNYQVDNLLALVRTASAAAVPTTATPPAMAPTTTTPPAVAPTRTVPTATRPAAPAAPTGRQ